MFFFNIYSYIYVYIYLHISIYIRALSFRLKKYTDKLTNVGQKGYSNTKQCQEVLFSLFDAIQNCKKNKIKGTILSLDVKKLSIHSLTAF